MNPKLTKWLQGAFFFSLPLLIEWVAQYLNTNQKSTILALMFASLAAYLKTHPLKEDDFGTVDITKISVQVPADTTVIEKK